MLPDGDYVYEDLSSDFVETDGFLGDLHDSGVTGYLSLEGEEKHGFALVEDGEPRTIKLFENGDERVLEGEQGIRELFESGSYTVDVVDCDESGREIVTIKVQNEEFKSGIGTDEVDLRNFLATNITDQDNDCHLMMVDDDTTGIVTFVDGLPVQSKFSTSEEILVGAEALDRILGYLRTNDVPIDIYKLTEREVEEEVGDKEEVIGEHVQDELQDLSETFEDKADDLLDEMGMDFMGGGDGDDGDLGDVAAEGADEETAGAGLGLDDDGDEAGSAADELTEEFDIDTDDDGDDDTDDAGSAADELTEEFDIDTDDDGDDEAEGEDGEEQDDAVDDLLEDMGIEGDE